MTLKVLEKKISTNDDSAIADLTASTEICLELRQGELRIFLDKRDVTEAIRSRAVTNAVSKVSMNDEVRKMMVREQRKLGAQGGVVVEGRDIGTVVFPEADIKIFMVAEVRERALRRQKELMGQGVQVDIDELVDEIRARDRKDSERGISPLAKADNAIELDTSNLSIEEQVDFILRQVERVQQLS